MEDDVACVCALFMMRRSDKQPDRVEISPEQLTAATIEADVSLVGSSKKNGPAHRTI